MPEPRPPIITLTTDYGTSDHYVGAMKGAILSISPHVAIVDITHEVPAHDVREAGWALRNAFPTFPRGTIHIAVADPGVGTARRPIVAATEGYYFVGPDNGVFSFAFEVEAPTQVITITAPHYLRSTVSATFHGRDVFAPVAAHLARGIDISNFGEPVTDYVSLDLPKPKVAPDGSVRAAVAHVDRFGNVVLNVPRSALEELKERLGASGFAAVAGAAQVTASFGTYGQAPAGSPFLLYNSSDMVEIAANQARAGDLLKLRAGDPVVLTPVKG